MTLVPLAPHLPFDPQETPHSFASRLARLHLGQDLRRFLKDQGIAFAALRDGRPEALARLAHVASVDLDALLRNTFRLIRGRFHAIRDEVWSADFVLRSTVRVCPLCLAGDEAEAGGLPRAARWRYRLAWHLRPVLACPAHRVALVPVAKGVASQRMLDFPSLFLGSPDRDAILRDVRPREPSPLQIWVEDRLEGHRDRGGPWLASQSLEQGVRASEMLGAMLLHGLKPNLHGFSPEDWDRAGA